MKHFIIFSFLIIYAYTCYGYWAGVSAHQPCIIMTENVFVVLDTETTFLCLGQMFRDF